MARQDKKANGAATSTTGGGSAPSPPVPADLEAHQVILRPLVTEKGMHRAHRHNQYAFEVNPLADKQAIRKAVEELFGVDVVKVRTQARKGKPRRFRFVYGRTKNWKKAVVTLSEQHRIDFF